MIVKIIRSSWFYWYCDKIGQMFNVEYSISNQSVYKCLDGSDKKNTNIRLH